MKYVVTVAGERRTVDVAGDAARLLDAGEAGDAGAAATLDPAASTGPVVVLRLGAALHRVIAAAHPARGEYVLELDGRRYVVQALDERTAAIRELAARSAPPAGPAPLVAPMPGLVLRVNVAVGDVVQAGQGLVVMEAMKMENELRSANAGTVRAVRTAPGAAVEKGTVLVELE